MGNTSASRDDQIVERLLAETGFDDGDDGDLGLRHVLLGLRTLAAEPPQASAQVAALMIPGATVIPDADADARAETSERADELAARRRMKRRLAITTFSVALSLAAGGAVAAASDQGVRDTVGQLHHAVTSFVTAFTAGPGDKSAENPVPQRTADSQGSAGQAPSPPVPVPASDAATPATKGRGEPSKLPVPAISGTVHFPGSELPGAPLLGSPFPGQPSLGSPSVPAVEPGIDPSTGPARLWPVPTSPATPAPLSPRAVP
ncbi:hypothetical protein [Pseudarthrobacter sp. N5]|uniref:hypothetical protein n=1 Tax=Pseudarthrobacter sp. N5 TaxID=3418416 RepID=UPI003CFA8D6E